MSLLEVNLIKYCYFLRAGLTFSTVFTYNLSFSTSIKLLLSRKGNTIKMSNAIIKTGGKQFSVETGQTLRVPSISDKKEGDKVDIEALFVSADGNVSLGGATVTATVVGHGRADKIIVFKKKRRKQYKRKQGHRQGYTEITIEKI